VSASVRQSRGPVGVVRSATEFRRNPRLWIFPPSLGSAKAHLCLRLSAAWPFAEVRVIDIFGECYGQSFCRLNPEMTLPVLEAEDKVVTGAKLIADFLQERYAGDGDGQAAISGRGPAMERFKALADEWDEELYASSSSRRPPPPRLADKLRLIRLRQQCLSTVEDSASSEEESSEGEVSGSAGTPRGAPAAIVKRSGPELQDLRDAYIRKIADLQNLEDVAGKRTEDEWRVVLQNNRRALNYVWRAAVELLRSSGANDSFLLGREFTTADAYFVPILWQMQVLRPGDLRRYLKAHPPVSSYWARMQRQEEAQVVLGSHSWGLAQPVLLKNLLPCQLLGVRCGCIVAPELPEEVEERIRSIQAELRAQQR